MKRRVLNALAGLSLILALATGGLWGRSYWVYDELSNSKSRGDLFCYIQSFRGRFVFNGTGPHGSRPGIHGWVFDAVPQAKDQWFGGPYADRKPRFLGFDYANQRGGSSALIFVAVPHWWLLLALAILPALRGWQLLRARRRRSENRCPQCGYDLRATPQRCPECGHETPAAARVILK